MDWIAGGKKQLTPRLYRQDFFESSKQRVVASAEEGFKVVLSEKLLSCGFPTQNDVFYIF
jgi:hypothetical protein